MSDQLSGQLTVDDSGVNYINTSFDATLVIKNIGLVTVFLGKRNGFSPGSGPIDLNLAYPLSPGESITVAVAAANGSFSNYLLAANTESGTSELRYIGRS
jgi:hypothetical protein